MGDPVQGENQGNGSFVRSFLPGLLVGLVVGLVLGSVLPILFDSGPKLRHEEHNTAAPAPRDSEIQPEGVPEGEQLTPTGELVPEEPPEPGDGPDGG